MIWYQFLNLFWCPNLCFSRIKKKKKKKYSQVKIDVIDSPYKLSHCKTQFLANPTKSISSVATWARKREAEAGFLTTSELRSVLNVITKYKHLGLAFINFLI